ncbi:MAG: ABC transporter permease [Pseudomonas sp.]|uniref:ABC transporter permease n=1 Tax=Stutzerimonas stutzeri subgroup TaxID=578833 RepID=UPI0012BF2C85|nr:ABC transporter permease [Stutzerimonas kunmingensis]MPS59347.1 ABC transporter permease [Pseudomonas sp.]
MILRLWQHRDLIQELAKREFSAKYKGSVAGSLWALLQPLLTLSVYTLTFGLILQSRGAQAAGTADYALWLFAGLVVYNAFSEIANKSVLLVVGNPNFVKKIVFPLEFLPVVSVMVALSNMVIGIFVWIVIFFICNGFVNNSAMYGLLVLLPLIPLFLGVSWILAALAVFARDVIQLVAMLAQALLFLSPIFYSVDQAPNWLRGALLVNPLAVPIEQLRIVLLDGNAPDFSILTTYFLVVLVFSLAAYKFFSRAKSHFGDMV